MTLKSRRRPGNAVTVADWMNRYMKQIFVLPAAVFVVLMLLFPLGYTLYLSMTDAYGSVSSPAGFLGGENYLRALTDSDRFWPAVGRTAAFTIGAVAIELVLGMAIALLLRRPFRGQGIVRVAILMPLVATPVAIGMMWLLLFEPTIGFVNELIGWFGLAPQGWISDPAQALPTLVFIDVWQWTPMVILILLAGLSSLPEEPDEAARVDGASNIQRFRYVTLPLLVPSIVTAVLLRSIDALKTFDILYATKGKGGGSFHEAETLNVYAYGLSFDYNDYGLASAVLILFFIMIIGVCGCLMWTTRKGANHS